MKIYEDSGYFNAPVLFGSKKSFMFVVGGRGTGKTYGTLKFVIEHDIRFIYLRRTQAQSDLVFSDAANVFKAINADCGYDIQPSKTKGNKYLVKFIEDGEEELLKGYGAALSTFHNLRSVDFSDVEVVIYDEFIPERSERPIKDEGGTFLNMVETISRNRELKGMDPVKYICLANSNDMGNPLFMQLKLVIQAEEMKRSREMVYNDEQRSLMLIQLEDSKISEAKRNTALYKLAGDDSDFSKMALDNSYNQMEYMNIRKLSKAQLREYRPLYSVGEITTYKHKHRSEYYICSHSSGAPREYGSGELSYRLFAREHPRLWMDYNHQKILFENYYCERIFTNIYI